MVVTEPGEKFSQSLPAPSLRVQSPPVLALYARLIERCHGKAE